MAGSLFKTLTFLVLVFYAVVVFAEDYDVGDDNEWVRPTDINFYKTWAAGKTFRLGDELDFEFMEGRHDVAVVTKEAFAKCDKMSTLTLYAKSPVKIALNTTGPHYYICTVGDHCTAGQKLEISVVAAGAAGGSATPAAGAKSAASSLGGATFLVAFLSSFVALF